LIFNLDLEIFVKDQSSLKIRLKYGTTRFPPPPPPPLPAGVAPTRNEHLSHELGPYRNGHELLFMTNPHAEIVAQITTVWGFKYTKIVRLRAGAYKLCMCGFYRLGTHSKIRIWQNCSGYYLTECGYGNGVRVFLERRMERLFANDDPAALPTVDYEVRMWLRSMGNQIKKIDALWEHCETDQHDCHITTFRQVCECEDEAPHIWDHVRMQRVA